MGDKVNLTVLPEEEESKTYSEAEHDIVVLGGGTTEEPAHVASIEQNKFDTLCNGALNAMALVHAAVQQLLGLKDELLKHSLPPNTLLGIALTTSQVFRSVSDLSMPINELVRMVRVYSQPWDEKSKSLKKLHDDYESKKAQLSIAIKRLQLLDAHSKRIAKEKRVMNWEKLFAKLTIARGHGRRWKFLIHAFQKKAAQGVEQLHQYIDSMERVADVPDSELEEDQDADDVNTAMQNEYESIGTPTDAKDEQEDEQEEEEEEEKQSEGQTENVGDSDVDETDEPGTEQTYVRPPMEDHSTWTHEPEYDRFLHLRIHKPEGLEESELRCRVSYGAQLHNTTPLDMLHLTNGENKPTKKTDDSKTRKPGRRGLIGSRPDMPAVLPASKDDGTAKTTRLFFECVFEMPDEELKNIWKTPSSQKNMLPEHVRIIVNHGPKQEMLAMASIGMDDLVALDLPSLELSPPDGATLPQLPTATPDEENKEGGEFISQEKLRQIEPLKFPLFSTKSTLREAAPTPIGQLPIICFWGKRLRPKSFTKVTESTTVRDIVLDMTGFDLNLVTKEELHKETHDQYVSPICFTPEAPPPQEPEETEKVEEAQEEMVPKRQYDNLIASHHHEMAVVQQEYELRLQDLAEALDQLQAANSVMHIPRDPSPMQPIVTLSSTPHSVHEAQPQPPLPTRAAKPVKSNVKIRRYKPVVKAVQTQATQYNETLPDAFLQRLKQYEDEGNRRHQELSERVYRQVAEVLEKRLAGENKLRGPPNEDTMLRDVSLPAVFMPSKGNNINIYNPRAHLYFHPMGAGNTRLTQPPSMVQLPPLPKNKINVLNLFELSQNFQHSGSDWLLDRFINQAANDLLNSQHAADRPISGKSSSGNSDAKPRSRKSAVVTPTVVVEPPQS